MRRYITSLVCGFILFSTFGCVSSISHPDTSVEALHSATTQPSSSFNAIGDKPVPSKIIRFISEPKDFGEWWLTEAKKRFANPIIVICHGGYNSSGEWCVYPEIKLPKGAVASFYIPEKTEVFANDLHKLYPLNEIILVVCNEKGLTPFHIPNVYYFRQSAWKVPDENVNFLSLIMMLQDFTYGPHETIRNFGAAGSIWEASN